MMSIKSNLLFNQCGCCCFNASYSNSITDFVKFIYLYLKQQRLKFTSKQYFIHNNNFIFQCNGLFPFKLDYNLFNQNIQIIIIIKDHNLLSMMTTSTFVHVFHFNFIDFFLLIG